MIRLFIELLGVSSAICFAASFYDLLHATSFDFYLKGNGLLFLIAGIGLSIPWLSSGKHHVARKSAYKSFSKKGTSRHLDWQQFELLTAEFLRLQHFKVANNQKSGADGGIDIKVERNGKKGIVQCKHYRKTKCGVGVVRELLGVLASEKLDFAIVVCTSGFTRDAREFANKNHVTLLSETDMINRKKVFA